MNGFKFFLIGMLTLGNLSASVKIQVATTVQLLDNGNILILDAGNPATNMFSKIIEVDSRGSLIWAYVNGGLRFAHSAEKLTNGNILITNTNLDQVIEINQDGEIVWSCPGSFDYPNDANRLSNGNTLITDRDNDRVVEVTSDGTIVWEYNQLEGPHNSDRLSNGNTLICDSGNNRVLEVDSNGNIVWSYTTGLYWPRDADRLANGNTLITDTHNHRIIEVTPGGEIVWSYTNLISPYEADRLPDGTTLISDIISGNSRILAVDSSGAIVWRYPSTIPVVVDTVWIHNPASGCTLNVHIHRPVDASPTHRFPGVIIIPGGNGTGTSYDSSGVADRIADDGFILVHFDPDGRGLSTNHGTYTYEDYCGNIQQDGLWEIAKYLRQNPYIDTTALGIYSQSYGITMASGMLARHPADPPIKFLLDWEGPADRNQTSQDSGGHVPVPVDSDLFWLEREAGRFMKSANVYYIRHQTRVDHNPNVTENEHAIALIDSTTAVQYGGKGISPWTRVNDSFMNPPNTVYTMTNPPQWVPETLQKFTDVRNLIYLHELALKQELQGIDKYRADNNCTPVKNLLLKTIFGATSFSVQLAENQFCSIRLFDSCGRLLREYYNGLLNRGLYTYSFRELPPGVYFIQVKTPKEYDTAKIVRIKNNSE